jgi:hypothetical protein
MKMDHPRVRCGLLLTPVFAVSVVVLAVNDRWLKAAWPGLVTGKLSDVAGVVMVAMLVCALGLPIRWSLAMTVISFAALKLIPAVAVTAAPVLGGVTRTDPTDLVALIALWPLARWLGRRTGIADPAGRDRPWRERAAWTLIPAKVVALGAAVLATTATSCSPDGVGSTQPPPRPTPPWAGP